MITSKKRTTVFFNSHQKSRIFEERGKKAQFYLVAAIIIALVIFSLATISNYAKENMQEPVVFDLKKELNLETGKVVDYAINNEKNINNLIETWTELYVESQGGKDVESWVFVYGTQNEITELTFERKETGKVCLDNICAAFSKVEREIETLDSDEGKTKMTVTLDDFKYDFDIKHGQNFAFVIKKEGYVASTAETKAEEDEHD